MHFVPLETGEVHPPSQDSKELLDLALRWPPKLAQGGKIMKGKRELRRGTKRAMWWQ